MTGELTWAWELPNTSKTALYSDEYLGAMGQGKPWASTFTGSLINLPLISYRGADSGSAPKPLDPLRADFSLKSAVDLWAEGP